MAKIDVQVLLTAKDNASKALKSFGATAKKSGALAEKNLEGAFRTIRKGALVAVAAISGISIAAGKLAIDAGKFLDVSEAFDEMAFEMGVSSEDVIRTVKEMTRGTLSKMDIMKAATRALSLIGKEQFEDFASEFGALSVAAMKAAKVMGVDVAFALDSLVLGVGRASKLIIDNLGITFQLSTAYEEYAKQLGKTTEELDDNERKTAVLNATLKAIREQQGAVTINTESMSVKWAQTTARLADLKVEIGTRVIPVFIKLIDNVLLPLINTHIPDLLVRVQGIIGGFERSKNAAMILMSAALAPLIVVLGNYIKVAAVAKLTTLALYFEFVAIGAVIGFIIIQVKELIENFKIFWEGIEGFRKKVGGWGRSIIGWFQKVGRAVEELFRKILGLFGIKPPVWWGGDPGKFKWVPDPFAPGGRRKIFGIQEGGTVLRPQLVKAAEAGPERFEPVDRTRGGVGGGNTFNVYVGMYAGTETEKRRIAEELHEALTRVADAKKMGGGEL